MACFISYLHDASNHIGFWTLIYPFYTSKCTSSMHLKKGRTVFFFFFLINILFHHKMLYAVDITIVICVILYVKM